jgi:CheY-like chemotaxis protein
VLDLHLPGMGGMEILERLRADEATRDVRVVILTYYDDEQLRQRAHHLRVLDYLDKTRIGPGQLARGVARWAHTDMAAREPAKAGAQKVAAPSEPAQSATANNATRPDEAGSAQAR